MSRARTCCIGLAALGVLFLAAWGPVAPAAAAPPQIDATWVTDVSTTSARLRAEINPGGVITTYHFDYITDAAYQTNLSAAKDGFSGALKSPAGSDPSIGSGTASVAVLRQVSALKADTTYHYRVSAKNSGGTVLGPERIFATHSPVDGQTLSGNRGWEMVSPVDKAGGAIEGFGANAGGGVLQASAGGGAITYSTSFSFGGGVQGAAVASQYISRRGSGGWSTQNITTPLLSGSYGDEPLGVPYQLFSGDLAAGLLLNGRHCRGSGTGCGISNSPLPGTEAPAGYQNYYQRNNDTGAFKAVLAQADVATLALSPEQFALGFSGATSDLQHVVFSTCAAIASNATEIPGGGGGCEAASPNLYRWSGSSLQLVNLLPGHTQGTPGAALAAQSRAISSNGSRIFWVDLDTGNLYLRDGSLTRQVDTAVGGGGIFQTAAADGSVAFFTKGGHLYRYVVAGETTTDLTPGGEVAGVLGASDDGSHVYYLTAAGLFLRNGATTVEVAATADPGNYPPSTGTARVSADGNHLVFLSEASLTGRDNIDIDTGEAVSEVFLYEAAEDILTCVSCNPTNGRPLGPSAIPGAIANGTAPGVTQSYKPRILAAGGNRVFFESQDALALEDTNADVDVYEWEAQGTGTCQRAGGCASLISSGRSTDGATFVDAAAGGSDVFFLTDGSLVPGDTGSVDLYDARVNGGFPVVPPPFPCVGDACQSLPPEPEDSPIGTLSEGGGQPPVVYPRTKRAQKKRANRKKRSRQRKHPNRENRHRARGRR